MINNLLMIIPAFARHMLISLSVDEILLLRYVNIFTNFEACLLKVEISPCLKCMNSVFIVFM